MPDLSSLRPSLSAALLAALLPTGSTSAQNRELDLLWLGSAGSRFIGEGAGQQAGRTVARAGDLNGDGLGDFVVSAWRDGFFDPPGRVYLVYGTGDGQPASASLSAADVLLLGAATGDAAGQSLAAAGDVDGDGYDDLLIGAPRHDVPGRTDAGRVYLIYGDPALPALINLGSMTAGQGTVFDGAATGHLAGTAVAGPGDLDGDGLADLAIGAQGASPLGRNLAGQVHVVWGRADFGAGQDLLGVQATILQGAVAGDRLGVGLAAAGDVHGDGPPDLLCGAPNADPGVKTNAGRAYLLRGAAGLPATIDTATFGSFGTLFEGQAAGHFAGEALAGNGDVNGDGRTDLLFGADQADPPAGVEAGRAFLVYGSASLAALVVLGSGGVVLDGAVAGDEAGTSVSLEGDLNGDGLADLVIGAQNADGGGLSSGQSYVVHGSATLPGALSLGSLSWRGVQLTGAAAGDRSGGALAHVGDVDGDGYDDLLVGSRLADVNGADAGLIHLVEGAGHLLLAEGAAIEGQSFTMKCFGPPGGLFLLWLAPAALPTPFVTNKGNWWLVDPIEIGVLGFDGDGRLEFPVAIPEGLGLSGFTAYAQFMASPQGFHSDLSGLLAVTVQ